jgi:hypothetical protein
MWISCGTWVQLWSGAIGALISGVMAAGVALLVVLLTIRYQRKQSDKELGFQKAQADAALVREQEASRVNMSRQQHADFMKRVEESSQLNRQLGEQRKLAKQGLDEQRVILERQLEEQRAESSKAREVAAIADMIAAVNGFISLQDNGIQMVPVIRERAIAAAFRWVMEQDDLEHLAGTMAHITLLGELAYQASEEALESPDLIAPSLLVLTEATSNFMARWAVFSNANAEAREAHFRWLADRSEVAKHVREAL